MPKFTDIKVDNEINVSSTASYGVDVFMKINGKRASWDYWIEGDQFIGPRFGGGGFPRYLYREVYRQLVELLADPATRFYEYDRDHNKRYEGLRYHDADRYSASSEFFERG